MCVAVGQARAERVANWTVSAVRLIRRLSSLRRNIQRSCAGCFQRRLDKERKRLNKAPKQAINVGYIE